MTAPISAEEILQLADLNLVEFWRESSRRAPGGEVVERDGVLLAAGGNDFPVLINLAMRVDPRVPDADVIAAADAYFGERGRGYTLLVRHHAEPSLADAASAAGFQTPGQPAPWLVLDERLPHADPPAGLVIERVVDEEGVRRFAEVGAHAFATYGMPVEAMTTNFDPPRWLDPHLCLFLGTREGEPVACAGTLVSHAVSGVYWVGTLPDFRGRGFAEALTRVAGNAGFDLGARFASLQASVMGDPIYRRMGYREIGSQQSWVRFTPPATA
ncbi:MAG TPA: GNAT family N-acetyltransferase [Acidimicrobiia bacterium]|nr:GNAT family N-acetyltransferase [Acidimicrobiia bacterium]